MKFINAIQAAWAAFVLVISQRDFLALIALVQSIVDWLNSFPSTPDEAPASKMSTGAHVMLSAARGSRPTGLTDRAYHTLRSEVLPSLEGPLQRLTPLSKHAVAVRVVKQLAREQGISGARTGVISYLVSSYTLHLATHGHRSPISSPSNA